MNKLNNKVQLLGNLGSDPEQVNLKSGKLLVRFSMATNERYKDENGNWQTRPTWHVCKCWNSAAEVALKHLRRGRQVLVGGHLRYEKWKTDAGDQRTQAVIMVNDLALLQESQRPTAEGPGAVAKTTAKAKAQA